MPVEESASITEEPGEGQIYVSSEQEFTESELNSGQESDVRENKNRSDSPLL
jgi:hypothetical protein